MSQKQENSARAEGRIVAGVVAPHPPHLVYGENPPQNEPRSECGWEELRWGYERLRKNLPDYDAIIVHSPHWKTTVGHHLLGLPAFKGLSVDPIFPNLFRFHYDLKVDVPLAEGIAREGSKLGLTTKLMRNPHFRVDYGTIISCHLVNPKWDKPIVAISSNSAYHMFSNEVGESELHALGQATREAVKLSGKRVLALASCSLSHRHFTHEAPIAEDMSNEHIYSHSQYLWDMRFLDLVRKGDIATLETEMPDFIEHSHSELKDGSFGWLMGALDRPHYPGIVHAYGTVIGTGNAIIEWQTPTA